MTADELTASTDGADATRALAAALAELARPGDLLLLCGDLGAGKTAFAQGFGRGLGVTDPVTSPTFALAQSYRGRLDLHHLDVYRLDHVGQAADLGLSELLDEGAVTLIEWGDTITRVLPQDYLEVHLELAEDVAADPDRREVRLVPVGSRWTARIRALGVAIGPWRGEAGRTGPGPTGAEA